jgi:hypothetical protein
MLNGNCEWKVKRRKVKGKKSFHFENFLE